MKRIAIIDHTEHELIVEDINEQELEENYDGDIQKYIDNNYDMEKYSWDWITYTQYFEEGESCSVEVEFKNLV